MNLLSNLWTLIPLSWLLAMNYPVRWFRWSKAWLTHPLKSFWHAPIRIVPLFSLILSLSGFLLALCLTPLFYLVSMGIALYQGMPLASIYTLKVTVLRPHRWVMQRIKMHCNVLFDDNVDVKIQGQGDQMQLVCLGQQVPRQWGRDAVLKDTALIKLLPQLSQEVLVMYVFNGDTVQARSLADMIFKKRQQGPELITTLVRRCYRTLIQPKQLAAMRSVLQQYFEVVGFEGKPLQNNMAKLVCYPNAGALFWDYVKRLGQFPSSWLESDLMNASLLSTCALWGTRTNQSWLVKKSLSEMEEQERKDFFNSKYLEAWVEMAYCSTDSRVEKLISYVQACSGYVPNDCKEKWQAQMAQNIVHIVPGKKIKPKNVARLWLAVLPQLPMNVKFFQDHCVIKEQLPSQLPLLNWALCCMLDEKSPDRTFFDAYKDHFAAHSDVWQCLLEDSMLYCLFNVNKAQVVSELLNACHDEKMKQSVACIRSHNCLELEPMFLDKNIGSEFIQGLYQGLGPDLFKQICCNELVNGTGSGTIFSRLQALPSPNSVQRDVLAFLTEDTSCIAFCKPVVEVHPCVSRRHSESVTAAQLRATVAASSSYNHGHAGGSREPGSVRAVSAW